MVEPEHKHTVLVIEDDPTIRNLLREALTSQGCKVVVATDVRKVANLLCSDRRPCIIFFDTMFSRVDADFRREQRRLYLSYGRAPIVALRASGVAGGVRVLGAVDCLETPFPFGRILDVVAKHWANTVRQRAISAVVARSGGEMSLLRDRPPVTRRTGRPVLRRCGS